MKQAMADLEGGGIHGFHGTRAALENSYYAQTYGYIHYAHTEGTQIKAKVYLCIAVSLQLEMGRCYQYESTYFPAPYANNQLFCSLCSSKQIHAFNCGGFKHNNKVQQ